MGRSGILLLDQDSFGRFLGNGTVCFSGVQEAKIPEKYLIFNTM